MTFLVADEASLNFEPEELTRFQELKRETIVAKLSLIHNELDLNACLPFNVHHLMNIHGRHKDEVSLDEEERSFGMAKHRTFKEVTELLLFFQGQTSDSTTLFLRTTLCYHLRWTNVRRRFGEVSFRAFMHRLRDNYVRSFIQPGEMVGSLAAESSGEPATQLNLNYTHHAGIKSMNMSSGISRLKELINACVTIKTPCSFVALNEPYCLRRAFVEDYAPTMNETFLKDLLFSATVEFAPDPFEAVHETDRMLTQCYRLYAMALAAHGLQGSRFVLRLVLDRTKLLKLNLTTHAVAQILRNYLPNVSLYHLLVGEMHMPELVLRIRMCGMQGMCAELGSEPERLEFEKNMAHLFLKHLSHNTYISGISGFSQAHVRVQKVAGREEYGIQLAGTDLRALWKMNHCDWRKTWCNSVLETAEVLGIEAATSLLHHEITQVLSPDGTAVDIRHLMLIVNVMMRTGSVTPLTRHGLGKLDVAPLVKATFEETPDVLFEAAQFGERNDITGVSDSIMFGQGLAGGTGCVTLLPSHKGGFTKEKQIPSHVVVRTRFSHLAHTPDDQQSTPTSPTWNNPSGPPSPIYVPSATSPRMEAPASPQYAGHSSSFAVSPLALSPKRVASSFFYRPSSPRIEPSSSSFRPSSP